MKPKMIIPMLICRDANAEIEFCINAFDAKELSRRTAQTGEVIHATLIIQQSMIMVHNETSHLASRAPLDDGSSPVVNYLYVDNVDEIMARAIALGAKIILPAEAQFWGDRVGRIIDPSRHVWNIASRVEEP